MGNFEIVGKPIELGYPNIEIDDAENLKRFILTELPVKKLEMGDDFISTACSLSTKTYTSDMFSEYDVPYIWMAAKVKTFAKPDINSTKLYFSWFRDSQRDTKIYKTYSIDTFGDEVVSAKRSLFINRTVGQYALHIDGAVVEPVRQRKQYDRPMNNQDIDEAIERSRRLVARISI